MGRWGEVEGRIVDGTLVERVAQRSGDGRACVFGYGQTGTDSLGSEGELAVRLNLIKGVVRGLLEIFCWGYWQSYSLLQRLLQQVSPDGATGEWLDMHAAGVDVTRRPATKARGKVRFARAVETGQDPNITVPAGRNVRPLPDGTGRTLRSSQVATADPPPVAAPVAQAAGIQARRSLNHGNSPMAVFQKIIHRPLHGKRLVRGDIGRVHIHRTADHNHGNFLVLDLPHKIRVLIALGQHDDPVKIRRV